MGQSRRIDPAVLVVADVRRHKLGFYMPMINIIGFSQDGKFNQSPVLFKEPIYALPGYGVHWKGHDFRSMQDLENSLHVKVAIQHNAVNV